MPTADATERDSRWQEWQEWQKWEEWKATNMGAQELIPTEPPIPRVVKEDPIAQHGYFAEMLKRSDREIEQARREKDNRERDEDTEKQRKAMCAARFGFAIAGSTPASKTALT